MSFASSPLRRLAPQVPRLCRSLQASTASAGGHGDAEHYIHAPHMYEIRNIKNRKLKYGIAISALVAGGLGLPFFAIHWQKMKAAG